MTTKIPVIAIVDPSIMVNTIIAIINKGMALFARKLRCVMW